jgi:hypothetical protein
VVTDGFLFDNLPAHSGEVHDGCGAADIDVQVCMLLNLRAVW